MTEIPMWWLVISAVFFVLNIFLFLVLGMALLKIAGVVKDLQPKIEQLTTKVEGVTEKINELTASTKAHVDEVGGRAKNVVTSVERITHSAAVQFEKFSPLLIGGMTALRLLSAVREYKQHGQPKNPKVETAVEDED